VRVFALWVWSLILIDRERGGLVKWDILMVILFPSVVYSRTNRPGFGRVVVLFNRVGAVS
jgi:hypothetical protein